MQTENALNELRILAFDPTNAIYPNQRDIASNVVAAFADRRVANVMVVAKTQSGKTGSMCATIEKYLLGDNAIPISNIYIITGLSSREWREQTQARVPPMMRANVYHGNTLTKAFVDQLKTKKNVLIIMDEIHIAAKPGQTLNQAFVKSGIMDLKQLYDRDVKIIEYTATPDGTIYDLEQWGTASARVFAPPGSGYVSSFDMLSRGQVKQCIDLMSDFPKYRADIMQFIDTVLAYDAPKYHIVRAKPGLGYDLFVDRLERLFDYRLVPGSDGTKSYDYAEFVKEANFAEKNHVRAVAPPPEPELHPVAELFVELGLIPAPAPKPAPAPDREFNSVLPRYGESRAKNRFDECYNDYQYLAYDGDEGSIHDLDQVLSKPPDVHTFIIVKELLRCAKTIRKEHLGVLYDRPALSVDDSAVIQGLVGRNTGYDTTTSSVCFTNIDSVERYEKLYDAKFETRDVKWLSKTTKCLQRDDYKLTTTSTFNDPKMYNGVFEGAPPVPTFSRPTPPPNVSVEVCESYEAVKLFYNYILKRNGTGPRKPKPTDYGQFEAPFSEKRVCSTSEVETKHVRHLTNSKSYKLYPCYKTLGDPNSIQWWFVYKTTLDCA